MRLVLYLTPLTLALVATTNVYALLNPPDSNNNFIVRRELPSDVHRRAELISIFPTRELVEELEQRLARRSPAGEAGKTGGNSGVVTPQSHAAAGHTDASGAAPPVIEMPKKGIALCMAPKTKKRDNDAFTHLCHGRVVNVVADDPIIDTTAGDPHSGAAKEGSASPKSPTLPQSGKGTGDHSLTGAHPQTEGQGSAGSKGAAAGAPQNPAAQVPKDAQKPL